jgi:hypothetical protein
MMSELRSPIGARLRGLPNCLMSAPALKARPAPINTIATIPGSALQRASAATIASETAGPRAFTGGLSTTMMPTRSSISKRTGAASPGPALAMRSRVRYFAGDTCIAVRNVSIRGRNCRFALVA